jgi:hypothetical protein
MNIAEPSVGSYAGTALRPAAADALGDDDQIEV